MKMLHVFGGVVALAVAASVLLESSDSKRGDVSLLDGVRISDSMLSRLEAASAQAGVPLVVTSGIRSTHAQARAMLSKLSREGADALRSLYRSNSDIIEELLSASATEAAWEAVIDKYVSLGRYISDHLRANAADLRSRDWDAATLAKVQAALVAQGLRYVTESDHLHTET